MICPEASEEQRLKAMHTVIAAMPHLDETFSYDEFLVMSALTLGFLIKGDIPKRSDWNAMIEFIDDVRTAETAVKN